MGGTNNDWLLAAIYSLDNLRGVLSIRGIRLTQSINLVNIQPIRYFAARDRSETRAEEVKKKGGQVYRNF